MALRPGILLSVAALPLALHGVAAQASNLQRGEVAFDAGHYRDALRFWSAAAEAGDARAAFDLGLLHDLGDGVVGDAAAAFQWYRRAAAEGLAAGQFNVGVMYDSGRGVTMNRTEAATWYARAAVQGQARAAFNLGQLYEDGEGVPRNPAMAAAWYSVAASQVPAAADRAKTLQDQPADRPGAPLVPPVPAWPGAGAQVTLEGASPAVQLVWTAPPEPTPVDYFVEVRGLADGRFKAIASGYATASAAAVTLTDDEDFAWRVYAVARDGGGYVASAWTRFSKTSALPPISAPPGNRLRAAPS